MTKSQKTLVSVCECAALVALAVAISFVKIPVGAFGGSIDFVMVPLFIICYRRGTGYGVASGLVFGLIKCIIGGGIGWGLPSILLDYVLAYGACGVAGLFRGKKAFLPFSAFVGCFARFIIHFISGITVYAISTETEISGTVTSNAWLYSFIYNGLYMLPNTVIAVAVMGLLVPVMDRIPTYDR